MFEPSQYELVDFGAGRKLERFGGELLDRPSPAADGSSIADPGAWGAASARFDLERGGGGRWSGPLTTDPTAGDEPLWSVGHGESRLLVQLSASGNVGLFPEQVSNWEWIADQVRRCNERVPSGRPRVLNLFAYTGGASLAAAIAGAEVTHVDSSGPTVTWAKRNAEASGVTDLPIRWLVEDAMKFVARECRRGNTYDGIIADPPTYGHGPKGQPFKFKQHLATLLAACGELLGPAPAAGPDGPIKTSDAAMPGARRGGFLLFSCHAPGFDQADAVTAVSSVLPDSDASRVESERLVLESADGRTLDAGVAARWSAFSR